MIVLNLICDFCDAQIDNLSTEEQVHKVMDQKGWELINDTHRCPECRTRAVPEGKTNQHQQTFLQNIGNGKCWIRCEKCKHTYLCEMSLAKSKRCPRQDRHK